MGVGRGYEAAAAPMQRVATAASQASAGLARATQAANENARAVGLTRNEYVNLGYQLSDIVSQASAGASAFTIFVQQGGQIAPVLAQAGGRLGEVFGQVTSGAASLAARVGLVGGVVGLTATAAVAAGYAWRQYAASQDEAERSLLGIGAASGASVAGINRISAALAEAQTLSAGASRSIASTLAATGRIDASVLGGVGGLTKGTASLFGESNADAATRLGELFANPTRGAEIFNQKLGILTASQKEYIQNLEQSGQRTAAQQALIDAVQPSLQRYTDQTWSISRAWQGVSTAIGSATDALGRFVSREVTGGTLQERLQTATRRYFNAQTNGQPVGSGDATYEAELRASGLSETQIQALVRPGAPGAPPRASLSGAQADLEHLNELSRRTSQADFNAARTAQQAQASGEVDAIVKALNPGAEKLKEIQRQAENIRSKLSILPVDEQGDARRTMEGLERQAKQIGEDLASGGQRFADALRNAQFNLNLVGASSTGRGLADAQEQYRRDIADLDRQNLNPVQRMVQERTLEQTRDANLARVRAETTLQANQGGGAFSRAPAAIQQQILDAVGRFPTVDQNILAGLLEKESNFTWTGPTRVLKRDGTPATTAWGRGQITNDAADDIRKIPGMENFDKYNVDTQVLGAAAYLNLRQRWAGGNQIRALDGYGTGPGYGVDVLRRAGRLGDASDQAGALQVDAARRAAEAQSQQLQNVTENYGRNTVALEANQRAQEQINAAIAAGRTVTGEFAASIRSYETAAASAARQSRITQFGVDMAFEEAQLGRSSRDQVGFARARSLLGETTSPEAQAIASRTTELADLREARSTFQDTASGLVSSLTRGSSAAQAFSNALSRLGDKLLNIGFDQIGASLFGGAKGGAGGIGGLFSSLFGGGGGSAAAVAGPQLIDGTLWFADGGVMTSQGAMPLHRYATGGIASSPQVAIFGEGRGPEAYVPLPDGRRIPVAMQGAAANSNGSGYTDARTISIDARGSTMSEDQIRGVVVQAIAANNQEQYRNQAVQAETYRRLAG